MASKLVFVRRLSAILKSHFPSSSRVHAASFSSKFHCSAFQLVEVAGGFNLHSNNFNPRFSSFSRTFCSVDADSQGPAAIDYRSLLQEDEFHKLADSTIHDLQEKLEEYGDNVQIDGLDIDYGNEVLTLKLGDLGTYVLNKQTPNRQLWLSSPLSGPSRFDWDRSAGAWIYRRTKANLLEVLETELRQLCGEPIKLT